MSGSGRVHYETGARINATCCGGIGVVRRRVAKLALAREIDTRLNLLERHRPYHESDHVLDIPSPTAASDFTRRFGEADVIGLMEAIDAVRPKLWQRGRRDLPGPVAERGRRAAPAPTLGQKTEGMDVAYEGVWGYPPLIVSLASTGEVLSTVHRPGNAVSHDVAAGWMDKAIDLVATHSRAGMCARGSGLPVHRQRGPLERDGGFHLQLRCSADARDARRGAGTRARGSASSAGRAIPPGRGRHAGSGQT